MDLVPAGDALRAQGKLEWPKSGLTMSLAGFQHVFSEAKEVDVGGGLRFKVAPPRVQALLKMGSYLDDPYGRQKDIEDFQRLLQMYEADSDRVFSDPVFDAGLADIQLASAFLLGYDMREIITEPDQQLIDAFLAQAGATLECVPATDLEGRNTETFRSQLFAFAKGLRGR
jgi:predicted nucleotidyltransferase